MSFWAFLVAVGNYLNNDYPKLLFFEDDVKELGQILEEKGKYKVTILSTEDEEKPRRTEIMHHYRTFLRKIKSQLNPHDTILIYFMGHGGSSDRTEKDYFLPYDAYIDLDKEDSAVPLDWLEMQMKKILGSEEINDYNIFFIIDACRIKETTLGWSGLKSAQTTSSQILLPKSKAERQPAGISWLYSCQAGHFGHTFHVEGQEHAIFTYHFIEFLKGANSHLLYDQLHNFLVKRVPKTAKEKNKSQIPSQKSPRAAYSKKILDYYGKINGNDIKFTDDQGNTLEFFGVHRRCKYDHRLEGTEIPHIMLKGHTYTDWVGKESCPVCVSENRDRHPLRLDGTHTIRFHYKERNLWIYYLGLFSATVFFSFLAQILGEIFFGVSAETITIFWILPFAILIGGALLSFYIISLDYKFIFRSEKFKIYRKEAILFDDVVSNIHHLILVTESNSLISPDQLEKYTKLYIFSETTEQPTSIEFKDWGFFLLKEEITKLLEKLQEAWLLVY